MRKIEEERAKAGDVYVEVPPAKAATSPSDDQDPATRLAKAKDLLDKALSSEAEYDTLKAKILSEM